MVNRPAELRSVAELLESAASGEVYSLVIEGEAGIGKTTLWLSATEQALGSGFQVLSARVGEAESGLAYAAVADLFRELDPTVLASLPAVQHLAVDRVLLRASTDGPATDQRVVAAALVSVVEFLAKNSPVLLAIDNVQWLDTSSQFAIAYAARQLAGRVGLLVTERCEPGRGNALTWLQLAAPARIERIRIGPFSLGGLHALISARLGRSFPRPTMARIAEISGGNPFFALELARAIDVDSPNAPSRLPDTLSELMRLRIGHPDAQTRALLLAAACLPDSTAELLTKVTSAPFESLAEAEAKGIIAIDGDAVRFTHPLLAQSVYTDASTAERRAMHRRLAKAIPMPELKARHMALASARATPDTLEALDSAARAARARGAPAAAAELIDLAIGLGGDTPARRINAAAHHLQAGNPERAHAVLDPTIDRLPAGAMRATALNLLAAMHIHDNSFLIAVDLLKRALGDAENNDPLRVHTLLMLSFAQLNAGEFDASLQNAEQASAQADELGVPALTSQVLAVRAMVRCMCGLGVDEPSLQRALELEHPNHEAPIAFRASANNALMLAYTGRLDDARDQMLAVRQHCVERGAETDLMFVSVFSTLIHIWRGDFTHAALVAEETAERAQQLGGDHMRVIAMTLQAVVAAYTGRASDAHDAGRAALQVAQECGSPRLADWSSISLGFLEVSLGHYEEALAILQPLMSRFASVPGTEIITSAYIPDAVEALVGVRRLEDAEPLIAALEDNGSRLDRPWMLAIGARCRSMWLAAHGDIEAAARKAQDAMAEHDRLPMPFERARTQLLLGQLQRRQRQKESAVRTFGEALQAFGAMGTPLWADRVRAELSRATVTPTRDHALTPSERQVAELAASGMTNKDVAAALFISPKTVEANLARIYRKLGIKTRAELGRVIGDGE